MTNKFNWPMRSYCVISNFRGAPKAINPKVNRTTALFPPLTVHDGGSKISVPKEVTGFIKSYRKRTAAEVRKNVDIPFMKK